MNYPFSGRFGRIARTLFLPAALTVLASEPLQAADFHGAIDGSFGVDDSGAAQYTIPIPVPPGRAGMEPALTLDYGSRDGSNLLGEGWSLGGLSNITRCAGTIAQDGADDPVQYDSTDRYCLDGQRLVPVSGTPGYPGTQYATEIDGYSKIVLKATDNYGPTWWEVHTQDGRVMQYGGTSDSQAEGTYGGMSRITYWALNRVTDAVGNYLTVNYAKDAPKGLIVPSSVHYAGNDNTSEPPFNKVEFVYESRPDTSQHWYKGLQTQVDKRLKTIEIFDDASVVRSFTLTYGTAGSLNRSHVTAITECEHVGGTQNCKPSTTFTAAGQGQSGGQSTIVADSTAANINDSCVLTPGDYDGDGRTDLYVQNPNGTCVSGTSFNFTLDAHTQGSQGVTPSFAGPNVHTLNWHGSDCTVSAGDFNGDGRADRYFHNGTGSCAGLSYSFVAFSGGSTTFQLPAHNGCDVYPGDFNGDGRTDLYIHNASGSCAGLSTSEMYFSQGTSLVKSTITRPGGNLAGCSVHTTDLDADGQTDLYFHNLLGTCGGTTNSWADLSRGEDYTTRTFTDQHVKCELVMADFNGDGLPDRYYKDHEQFRGLCGTPDEVYTNLGNDTFDQGTIANTGAWSSALVRVHPGDYNGDGLTDLYFHPPNGGNNQGLIGKMFFSDGNSKFVAGATVTGGTATLGKVVSGDFNGDGITDLFFARLGPSDPAPAMHFFEQTGGRLHLTAITDGLGKKIEIDYAPMAQIENGGAYATWTYMRAETAAYPLLDLASPMRLVSEVRVSDGTAANPMVATSRYRYRHALYDREGRGFLGFKSREVDDLLSGRRTATQFRQDFPFVGLTQSSDVVTIASGGAVRLSAVANTYAAVNNNGGLTWFPYASRAAVETLEPNDGNNNLAISSRVTETVYNTTGGELDNFGYPDSVAVTRKAGPENNGTVVSTVVTQNSYLAPVTSPWQIGRLSEATVTHTVPGQAVQSRTSSFTYNADGLLASETVEPNSSTLWQTTSYTYDAYGNKTSATVSGPDFTTRSASTVWGTRDYQGNVTADGRFPVTQTNALGQQIKQIFDTTYGNVLWTQDANGLVAETEYDGFGRVTVAHAPDGTRSLTGYADCAGDTDCPTDGHYKVTTQALDTQLNPMGAVSSIYFDRLGRDLRTVSEGFDAGSRIFADKSYDARGNVATASRPYDPDDAGDIPAITSYVYDIADRVIQEVRPADVGNHMIDTVYDGLTTTITETYKDADGNTVTRSARSVSDALGQTVSVTEDFGGADAATTTQTYDAVGNLLTTTGPNGAVVSKTYDQLGRNLTLDDPNSGTWSYEYNALGELVSQTDALGQVTVMAYDLLGRMVSRTEDNTGSTNKATTTWIYDTATNGVGLLHSVSYTDNSGNLIESRTSSYDSLSRPTVTTQLVGHGGAQKSFATATSYDAVTGRQATLTYPSFTGDANAPLTVAHDYNARGYLTDIRDNAAGGVTFWQAQSMDAEGQVTAFVLGNGVTTERLFTVAGGTVSGIESTASGGPNNAVQHLQYAFDAAGTVRFRMDHRIDRKETFSYDGHDRLTGSIVFDTANAISVGSRTYSYDLAGNLLSRSDLGGTYSYGLNGAGPHAVSLAGGKEYLYDANGQLTTRRDPVTLVTDLTVAWSAFNKATLITDLSGATSSGRAFLYGADRARLKQTRMAGGVAGTSIWYAAGSLFEYDEQNMQSTAYVFAGDTRIALVRHTGLVATTKAVTYLHQDHLGSTDTVTDATGAVVERLSYGAFGKRRNTDWTDPTGTIAPLATTRGFTGHEHLESLSLIHMNGRIFDPVIGRFLSTDPAYQNLTGSQALNRYSYVLNNPLSYTDPTGFFFKKIVKAVSKAFKSVVKTVKKGVKSVGKALSKNSAVAAVATIAIAITGQYYLLPVIEGIVGTGTIAASVLSSAASAAAATFVVSGGDLEASAISALSGAAFAGVGVAFKGADIALKTAAHAAVGGTISELQGGKFAHGALAAGFTKLATPVMASMGLKSAGKIAASAVVGGIAAKLGGGKFANGAITGAFGTLYNELAGSPELFGDKRQASSSTLGLGFAEGSSVPTVSDIPNGEYDGLVLGGAIAGPATLATGGRIIAAMLPTMKQKFISVSDRTTNLAANGIKKLLLRGLQSEHIRKYFGKGGRFNSGKNFRIGFGRNGGELVFRMGGSYVTKIFGKSKVDIVNLGKIPKVKR